MEKEIDLTVGQIRSYFDDGSDLGDDFDTALDEAQGEVFNDNTKKARVIINIIPDTDTAE